MADIYNVIRGDGVFFEGMTKEQIYELIAEMTGETTQDIDQAFITKLKEINKGNSIRLWLGTSAEYNALTVREDDVLYICTDDTFVSDTNAEIQKLWNKIESNYDSLTKSMNDFETVVNDRVKELEDMLNAPSKSYTFTKTYDYGDITTFTIPDDLPINEAYNIYVTINCQYQSRKSGVNTDLQWDVASDVNFKTSGRYTIMEREVISASGIDESWINGVVDGTTEQKAFGIDSHNDYDIDLGNYKNFPVYSVTVRIRVIRESDDSDAN